MHLIQNHRSTSNENDLFELNNDKNQQKIKSQKLLDISQIKVESPFSEYNDNEEQSENYNSCANEKPLDNNCTTNDLNDVVISFIKPEFEHNSCSSFEQICAPSLTIDKQSNIEHNNSPLQLTQSLHPDIVTKNVNSDFFYRCHICQKVFSNCKKYENHKKVHGNIEQYENPLKKHNNYQCDICMKTFSTLGGRTYHIRLQHGIVGRKSKESVTCPLCLKQFSQEGNLNKHIATFHENKRFNCTLCTKSFKQRFDLKIHMHKHDGIKPYQCNTCSDSFYSMDTCRKHVCHGYKINEQLSSGYLRKIIDDNNGDVKYSCNICGTMFKNKYHSLKHIELHSNNDGKFKCKICFANFKQKYLLTRHMFIAHSNDSKICCKICNKLFRSSDLLDKHLKLHDAKLLPAKRN